MELDALHTMTKRIETRVRWPWVRHPRDKNVKVGLYDQGAGVGSWGITTEKPLPPDLSTEEVRVKSYRSAKDRLEL